MAAAAMALSSQLNLIVEQGHLRIEHIWGLESASADLSGPS